MRKDFGFFRLISRLLRDEEGSYLLYMTLLLPVLIGVAGLATEGGLLFYNHRALQSAADAAAYSAAIAYSYDSTADVTRRKRKRSLRAMALPLARALIRPM